METFVQQGSVSIPSLESVNNDDEVKRVDLNKAMFNSKRCSESPNTRYKRCLSMEEVITKEEQQGERILTLFPLLEKLELYRVPKLAHFFLTECALEIPCLEEVRIHDCPEMKTFIKQETSVSTPCLKSVNNDYRVKVGDLNIWTQQRFNSKEPLYPK
ncbi:hypothetical protein KY290_024890 [Solanum tuberosum]|uniref:Disease resistance protein n=1 Tax=Solanum tuberosum TaxID=4113 RepID=A0ABQ7URZ5_SOLTU|nr:hypothetical protein KY284_023740 [Solanum tuberosum]KAH0754620.1 hypothetical protein KY290_024890 [Solanum tuberosum]